MILPVTTLNETPGDRGDVPRYEMVPWRRDYGLVAGIAGGQGGLDFSLAGARTGVGAPPAWEALRIALGFDRVVAARQVHATNIQRHIEVPVGVSVLHGVDGHLTDQGGILLAVTVADCVPVFLAEPASGTMALLHAGWRGVAGGMLEAGVAAVIEVSGAPEKDIVMHCGISICGECYEVGPEVLAAVNGRPAAGPAGLDLRRVLAERARSVGIGAVTVSPLCTAHSEAGFHSHRASKGSAGRMVAYLGRPPA